MVIYTGDLSWHSWEIPVKSVVKNELLLGSEATCLSSPRSTGGSSAPANTSLSLDQCCEKSQKHRLCKCSDARITSASPFKLLLLSVEQQGVYSSSLHARLQTSLGTKPCSFCAPERTARGRRLVHSSL